MSYYIQSNYLIHHGIKGQKWGVRRYQNPDGSLTSAGLERYGGKREYKDSVARSLLTGRIGNFTGGRSFGEVRSEALGKRQDKMEYKAQVARAKGKEARALKFDRKAKIAEQKKSAQDAANDDRAAYDRHTSTGKMLAQNLLLTGWGAESYRTARARGDSRGKAFAEMFFGDYSGGKKQYGDYTI